MTGHVTRRPVTRILSVTCVTHAMSHTGTREVQVASEPSIAIARELPVVTQMPNTRVRSVEIFNSASEITNVKWVEQR
jgi:hypothetical protein